MERTTRTRGHADTRTRGHADTRTRGHADTRTRGHADSTWLARVIAWCVMIASLVGSSGAAHAQLRVAHVEAPEFAVLEIELQELQTTVFEVVGAPGTDEVIHLVRMDPNTSGGYDLVRVASNAAATPPLGSPILYTTRISYRPVVGQGGRYMLIVRSAAFSNTATASVYVNGQMVASNAPAGGAIVPRTYFAHAPSGFVTAVAEPGGSTHPVMMAFTTSTELGIARFAFEGVVPGATSMDAVGSHFSYFFGTPRTYLLDTNPVQVEQFRPGFASVYINDFTDFSTYPVSKDKDGDGVGDLLEQALGTCWDPQNCAPEVADSRDTDRDGLPDGEERFGVPAAGGNSRPWLPPRWGADPMHKDLFLIVGWLGRYYDTSVIPAVVQPYSPFDPSNQFNRRIDGLQAWITEAQQVFMAGPGDHVMNPERLCPFGSNLGCTAGQHYRPNGIQLHLDFGFSHTDYVDWGLAMDPADAERLFGVFDSQAVHRVPNARRFVFPADGAVSLVITSTESNRDGVPLVVNLNGTAVSNSAALAASVAAHFGPELIVTNSGVGSDGFPYFDVDASDSQWNFTLTVDVVAGAVGAIRVGGVEPGQNRDHALDDDYFPENFRKRARYAIINAPGGGGQANSAGGRYQSGSSLRTFIHELGHTLGMQHTGHDQWLEPSTTPAYTSACGTEFNCLASYRSIMNYSDENNTVRAFAANDAFVVVNPTRVQERNTWAGWDWTIFDPLANPAGFAAAHYDIFHAADAPVTVPGSSIYGPEVDWNHSGDSSADLIRTSLRGASQSCRAYSEGMQQLTDKAAALAGDVTIAEAASNLYGFWVEDIGTGPRARCVRSELGDVGDHGCVGESSAANYACNVDPFVQACSSCVPSLGGQPTTTNGCFVFSDCSNALNTNLSNAVAWDAIGFGGNVILAAIEKPQGQLLGTLVVYTYTVDQLTGQLTETSRRAGAAADGRPELVILRADPATSGSLNPSGVSPGWSSRLGLFVGNGVSNELLAYRYDQVNDLFVPWLSAGLRIASPQYQFPGGAPALPETVLTDGYTALVGWPSGEISEERVPHSERATCGYISDTDGALVPHCFDGPTERWIPVLDTVVPGRFGNCAALLYTPYVNTTTNRNHCLLQHVGPIDLAMRHHRLSDGTVNHDAPSGNLILSFRVAVDNAPRLLAHRPVGAGDASQAGMRAGQWQAMRVHWFKDRWVSLNNRAMDLHETVRSGGMSAMASHPTHQGQQVAHVFPFADGITDTDFGVLSDYRIMREHLCRYAVPAASGSVPLVQCGGIDVRQ